MRSPPGAGGAVATAHDAAVPRVPDAGRTPAARDAGRTPDAHAAAGDASVADASTPNATRAGWTLTFSDEFDGPSGAAVDATHWTPVNKGDGFGNNELEFYTNRTDNAHLDGNGSLVIEVRKETYMGRMYTSARLESTGKFEQARGRFETRAKLPYGQGIWPAFWLLGNDISSVSWPNCGEIDIMENVGREPSINHGSLHGPGYSGGNPLSGTYTLPQGQKFKDDFHVFAVEWDDKEIRFYVDDHLYETRAPKDVPSGGRWVYDHPFYMIVNVAVGGPFPGSPDGTTVFPQQLEVDYIRVYKAS